VVQILLESISGYWHKNKSLHFEMLAIVNEFNQDALAMCMHTNGNHVIQTILNHFKASEEPQDADIDGSEDCQQFTDFVFEACMTWPVEIGTHKQGCCVMQRCLEKGRLSQKEDLARVIIQKMAALIEDPFGNYLVQNVLKMKN